MNTPCCSHTRFIFNKNHKAWKIEVNQISERMENRIHQRRVSFSDTKSSNHHGSSGSRNNSAWNWLQWISFHDGDLRDDEHITSVAAAAFAIHSLEKAELHNSQKMREVPKSSRTQTMRRKEDNISRRPSYGEISIKRSFALDPRTTRNASPVKNPSGISSSRPVSPMSHKNVKTRPETWEKAMMEKIQKWYRKLKSKVLSWKCVKKIQGKHQVESKRGLEHRRAMEKQNYWNRISTEDMIAQSEDKRRKQESEGREKVNEIRKTGKVPVKCSCFNT